MKCFKFIQYLVRKKKIVAGMGKQKGGLITTVAKMALSQNNAVYMWTPEHFAPEFLFNEEAGVVIQTPHTYYIDEIMKEAKNLGLPISIMGQVEYVYGGFDVRGSHAGGVHVVNMPMQSLRKLFTKTSGQIESMCDVPKELIQKESDNIGNGKVPAYKLTYNPDAKPPFKTCKQYSVAILSAKGTNGEDELAYMFGKLGKRFKVVNVKMKDLENGLFNLKDFSVIAFAGGFSYGDVLGSGKGWAASIIFNEKLRRMFYDFFNRPNTLSFGVCNGDQVGTLLGIFNKDFKDEPRLIRNDSGRFEHRFTHLTIPVNTTSVMMGGMGGSVLGTWSAHGEGKLYLPNQSTYEKIIDGGMVALQYVNYGGIPTTEYPFNPSGSPFGIAGICTKDGRHTYIMPHIERVIATNHHMPYFPVEWKYKKSVWMKCVENMYLWLEENS